MCVVSMCTVSICGGAIPVGVFSYRVFSSLHNILSYNQDHYHAHNNNDIHRSISIIQGLHTKFFPVVIRRWIIRIHSQAHCWGNLCTPLEWEAPPCMWWGSCRSRSRFSSNSIKKRTQKMVSNWHRRFPHLTIYICDIWWEKLIHEYLRTCRCSDCVGRRIDSG